MTRRLSLALAALSLALAAHASAAEPLGKFEWSTKSAEAKQRLADLQARIESFQFGADSRVAASQALQRHVQLKDLFEQLRWHVLGLALSDFESFFLEHVLGAQDRVAERPVSVVQQSGGFERISLLVGRTAEKPVRVNLAAKVVKSLLELVRIKAQPAFEAHEPEVVGNGGLKAAAVTAKEGLFRSVATFPAVVVAHQAEKEVPQPQLFVAFGLSNTKPEWMRDSL